MSLVPFDDRDGWIWLDGKLVDWREAKIHTICHGLHYAGCVFEGNRCYNGVIFKLREHSQRLIDSAKILGMTVPYSVEEIDAACIETLKANNLTDAYVRPFAWRGSEQMGVSAQQTTIHMAVAVWEWPSYFDEEAKEKGIRLKTSKWRRPAPDTAPVHAKAAGLYMICTMAKHEAEAAGYHDALMHDYRGRVAEATGANFFMVKKNIIYTPPADCFLDGITRRTVIGLARDKGYTVEEKPIMPDELAAADEIFITGTAAEVTAIGVIDDMTFEVGAITRDLRDAYAALVREPS